MKRDSDNRKEKGTAGWRSSCPLACVLDLIGDKWTLLIIRDMYFFGKSRYDEFLSSPEKISTNILASRLKSLEKNGLIRKVQYSTHSQRMNYELTEQGASLAKLLRQFVKWGLENIPATATPEFQVK